MRFQGVKGKKLMMPLGDDDSKLKSTQLITPILIGINILVFFLEMAGGETFIMKWAFIPSRFLESPFIEFPTVFTSMFMHAGFAHLFGNMLTFGFLGITSKIG